MRYHARVLARHLGRHIPGHPSVVVQNMPGAGSLRAANYIYNAAPKDGTMLGVFARGMAMEPLIGTSGTNFDSRKFAWIGSGTNEVSVCATWHAAKVKTWSDGLAIPFTVAGEGSGSDPDIFSIMLRNVFGAKMRLVSGYPGGADMTLAIERGEVDGRCGWTWSSVKLQRRLGCGPQAQCPHSACHAARPRIAGRAVHLRSRHHGAPAADR
jgi:tripartite-type tricarboxylate transporter receptor subunit TctC